MLSTLEGLDIFFSIFTTTRLRLDHVNLNLRPDDYDSLTCQGLTLLGNASLSL